MTAQIIHHPAAIAAHLKAERLRWMKEAARFKAKGDDPQAEWCKGRAGGIDYAIVLMGGEGISLRIGDHAESGAV